MHFDHVDWDDESFDRGNARHVAHNGVSKAEFEEVFEVVDRADVEPSHSGPGHLTAVGETEAGRELRIVFELDESPDFVMVRPITAYDPGHE
jgi:hypothetical protein